MILEHPGYVKKTNVLALLGLFLPFILLYLPVVYVLFCLLIPIFYFSENRFVAALIASFLISLVVFRWLISSFYISIWGGDVFVGLVPYIVSLFIICFFARYVNPIRYLAYLPKYSVLTIISLLIVLFTYLRGPLLDTVAINYLGNVFVPFSFQIFLTGVVLACLRNSRRISFFTGFGQWMPGVVDVLIISACMLNVVLLLLDVAGILSLDQFFQPLNLLLRGEGSVGHTVTVLLGFRLPRWPGVFADPILSAYVWVAILFYIEIFWKNLIVKTVTSLLVLLWLVLALSKAALMLYVIGRVGLVLFKFRGKRSLYLVFSCCTVAIVGWYGVNSSGLDSSYIHTMGLLYPFTVTEGFGFLVGNVLSDAGNLGGQNVMHGAESFVGLLMYTCGLLGVSVYMFYFLALVIHSFSVTNKLTQFIVAAIIPTILTSFYQENVYNMTFVVPRLFLLMAAAGLYASEYLNKYRDSTWQRA